MGSRSPARSVQVGDSPAASFCANRCCFSRAALLYGLIPSGSRSGDEVGGGGDSLSNASNTPSASCPRVGSLVGWLSVTRIRARTTALRRSSCVTDIEDQVLSDSCLLFQRRLPVLLRPTDLPDRQAPPDDVGNHYRRDHQVRDPHPPKDEGPDLDEEGALGNPCQPIHGRVHSKLPRRFSFQIPPDEAQACPITTWGLGLLNSCSEVAWEL